MRLGPSGSLPDFEHISTPAEKVRVNHGPRQPIFSAFGVILSIGGAGSDVALCAREHGDIDAGFDYRNPATRFAAKNGDG